MIRCMTARRLRCFIRRSQTLDSQRPRSKLQTALLLRFSKATSEQLQTRSTVTIESNMTLPNMTSDSHFGPSLLIGLVFVGRVSAPLLEPLMKHKEVEAHENTKTPVTLTQYNMSSLSTSASVMSVSNQITGLNSPNKLV